MPAGKLGYLYFLSDLSKICFFFGLHSIIFSLYLLTTLFISFPFSLLFNFPFLQRSHLPVVPGHDICMKAFTSLSFASSLAFLFLVFDHLSWLLLLWLIFSLDIPFLWTTQTEVLSSYFVTPLLWSGMHIRIEVLLLSNHWPQLQFFVMEVDLCLYYFLNIYKVQETYKSIPFENTSSVSNYFQLTIHNVVKFKETPNFCFALK